MLYLSAKTDYLLFLDVEFYFVLLKLYLVLYLAFGYFSGLYFSTETLCSTYKSCFVFTDNSISPPIYRKYFIIKDITRSETFSKIS